MPFKGGAQAMTEVVAERTDFFLGPVALVLPLVREGKLTALVVNGANRSAALPNVPTMREAGFANAEFPIWLESIFLRRRRAISSKSSTTKSSKHCKRPK